MTWLIDFIEQGGTELLTRDGRKATQLTHFSDMDSEWVVAAIVEGCLISYRVGGTFTPTSHSHGLDLMKPEQRYWHCYEGEASKGNYRHGAICSRKNSGWAYQDEIKITPL